MALVRIKVWNPGDVLTAVDLNAEFNNIINNTSSFPLTANVSFGGFSATNIGGLTINAGEIQEAQGSAIVSANAVLTLTSTGNNFHVTGATGPILGYSAQQAGTVISITYDSTPTLTHNATSFILMGAANYTCVAGFTHLLVSEGAANWREISRGGNFLTVPQGGTGLGTLTANALYVGAGTSVPTAIAVPASGTILQGVAAATPVWTATPTLGVASGTVGQLKLANATNANILTLQPGATGSALTFTLPTADGTVNQFLKTNGSAVLSFAAVPGSTSGPTSTSTGSGYAYEGNVTISASQALNGGHYYGTFTLNASQTLTAADNGGLAIFANGTVTINGAINATGGGAPGGLGQGINILTLVDASGRDGTAAAGGSGGGGQTATTASGDGGDGSYGGAIGGTPVTIGGATGIVGAPATVAAAAKTAIAAASCRGGGGGGGGGGDSATAGVSGGSGGGSIVIVAPTVILGVASVLTTNGAAGVANVVGGAGGGGGAGNIYIITSTFTNNGATFNQLGGAGGAGGGGGGAGGAGGTGVKIFVIY